MNKQGEADAPLLSHQTDNDSTVLQKPAGQAGASVDPTYKTEGGEVRGRRSSITSLDSESDLELDDMHADYQRAVDDEERGLRGNANEDHISLLRSEDITNGRASIESTDMWQEAAEMGKQAFLKKAAINASLIAMWYCFSICISVVSAAQGLSGGCNHADWYSITNGCFRQEISTFTILSSRPLSIWLFSSYWHASCYCASHDSDLNMALSILTTKKTRAKPLLHQHWRRAKNQS